MQSNDISSRCSQEARPLVRVSEYCERAGVGEAEERRLIVQLGCRASQNELQINLTLLPFRTR
ncbi:hypothetical protein E5S70_32125 [Ensifer adhaerens]|nr:hypothetical protein [Ensifer canadensis]